MRLVWGLALVVLLAGCTGPEASEPPGPTPAPAWDPPEVPTVPFREDREPASFAPSRPLEVRAQAVERWVRPGEEVRAGATAPGAVAFSWFLASRNPTVPGTEPSTTFGQRQAPVLLAPNETFEVPTDRTLRHVLAVDESSPHRLNVTISREVQAGDALVRIVPAPGGDRFLPDDILVPLGARVQVQNELPAPVTLQGVDVTAPVGSPGPRVSFPAPSELGDYDLVVVASDGDTARGSASIRLIIDKRKPDANQTHGPWTGTIQRPTLGLPGEEERSHAFALEHAAREAILTFNASSSAPADVVLRIRVLTAAGEEVAQASGKTGEVALGRLEKGEHEVLVATTSGVNVDYAIEVRVSLDLVPPASFFNT